MARVYRNVSTPLLLFGLELVDLVIFLLAFLVLFNLSSHFLLNVVFLIGLYFTFRWMKRGRPPGYSADVVRFILRPMENHVRLENSLPTYRP